MYRSLKITMLALACLCSISAFTQANNYFAPAGAGQNNTTGTNNTGVGALALNSNTTGSYNTGIGSEVLKANTNGYYNIGVGHLALKANTSGSYNTSVGTFSMSLNSSGRLNTAVGFWSLNTNTTGFNNSAFGYSAMGGSGGAGNNNGNNNVAIGLAAMEFNTTGSFNVASGVYALHQNKTGQYNTAIGNHTMRRASDGQHNTAMGDSALLNNNQSSYNVAIGTQALLTKTSGDNNTAVGVFAGATSASLINCTFLGAYADASKTGLVNSMALGAGADVNASNKVVVGNTAVTSIGGQVGWTTYSDLQLKKDINPCKLGIDFIMALKPVTYHYKTKGQENILYTGLIAQELDAAAKQFNMELSAVDKTGDKWGIRYGELTVPLIKAVQEMQEKHTAEVSELKKQIEELRNAIAVQKTKTSGPAEVVDGNILYQNQPNPFGQATTIFYNVKNYNDRASISIRNMNGVLLKEIPVQASNTKGQLVIQAGEFAAGTYTYTLNVNGVAVETKLMVLVK